MTGEVFLSYRLLMRILFFFFMMIMLSSVQAQQRLAYTAGLEVGFLKGNSGNSNGFLFTNGIAYKNTMAGIGSGVDNYVFGSIPVFLDVRKAFGHHHVQPFINASAGINFHYLTEEQKSLYSWQSDIDYKNGLFAKTSAGVSLAVDQRLHIFASAGYSYKTTRFTYHSYSAPSGFPPDENSDTYRLNRWYFAIGFWF